MPVSLHDFPDPNPFFGNPLPPAGRAALSGRLLRWSTFGLLAVLGLCIVGLPAGGALWGDAGFNWPARVFFFAWPVCLGTAFLARRHEWRRRWMQGEVVPAEISPHNQHLTTWILGGVAMFILSLGAGCVLVFLRQLEVARKQPFRLTTIERGRAVTRTVWLNRDVVQGLLPGTVVWVTRPSWLVPAHNLDRTTGLSGVEPVPAPAWQWFQAARQRAYSGTPPR